MKKLFILALLGVVYQFSFATLVYLGLGGAEFFGANATFPEMNNPENNNLVLNILNSIITGTAFYFGFQKFGDKSNSNSSGAKLGFFVSVFAVISNNISNESFNNLYISNSIAALESLIWVFHFIVFGVITSIVFRKIKD
tara:strand:- start:638 stop:1057 length:420 start_codon:yes stop_codon:yes gene_type:complete